MISNRNFTLKPRDWQARHLASCLKRFTDGEVRHMSVITPAGGKTYAGAMVAADMLNRNKVDRVVVLLNALTTIGAVDPGPAYHGWLGDLAQCEVQAYKADNEALAYGWRKGFEATILTYAQVAADPRVLRDLIGNKRVLVICDEPHHLAQEQTWGEAVRSSTVGVPCMLLMTGTPVRTAGFMPWPDLYESMQLNARAAQHEVQWHFKLDYFEALNGPEQIVRPVEFIPFDASGQWVQDGKLMSGDFNDKLDPKGRSALLRAACDPRKSAAQGALRLGVEKLQELRKTDPTAGMLVVCMGSGPDGTEFRHVDGAAKYLKKLGVDTLIVHSEIDGAAGLIDSFRKSAQPAIAAIQMISEGTSIKRLRVVVFLTNIVTNLAFDQIVGRVLRADTSSPVPLPEQFAYVIHPADERLIGFAKAYKDATLSFKTFQADPDRKAPEKGDPTRVIDSTFDGRRGGIDFDGTEITQAEIERAARAKKAANSPVSETHIAKLMKVMSAAPVNEEQPQAGPRIDTRDPKALNGEAANLIKQLVNMQNPRLLGTPGFGPAVVEAHTRYNNAVGALTQAASKTMSNEQIDHKIRLIKADMAKVGFGRAA